MKKLFKSLRVVALTPRALDVGSRYIVPINQIDLPDGIQKQFWDFEHEARQMQKVDGWVSPTKENPITFKAENCLATSHRVQQRSSQGDSHRENYETLLIYWDGYTLDEDRELDTEILNEIIEMLCLKLKEFDALMLNRQDWRKTDLIVPDESLSEWLNEFEEKFSVYEKWIRNYAIEYKKLAREIDTTEGEARNELDKAVGNEDIKSVSEEFTDKLNNIGPKIEKELRQKDKKKLHEKLATAKVSVEKYTEIKKEFYAEQLTKVQNKLELLIINLLQHLGEEREEISSIIDSVSLAETDKRKFKAKFEDIINKWQEQFSEYSSEHMNKRSSRNWWNRIFY